MAGRVSNQAQQDAEKKSQELERVNETVAKVKAMTPQFASVLPAKIDPQRFTRLCLNNLRTVKNLANCSDVSLLGGMMNAAQLGLEVGGPLGQTYLVPFYNSNLRTHEATFIVGYKGFIELAYRSGKISKLVGHEVKELDEFSSEFGDNEAIVHKVNFRAERGRSWAWYAIAHLENGQRFGWVMNREEVETYRGRSKAKDGGPWVSDYDAMAIKTCVRRLSPFLPKSPEFADALAMDETVAVSVNPGDIVPPSVIDVDGEEIIDAQESSGDAPDASVRAGADVASAESPDGALPLEDDDPERPF